MQDIDWVWLFTSFEGRINRGKFWAGVVVILVVEVILILLATALNSTALWLLTGVVYLASIWATLALQAKRWHDRGKTAWWILIGFVPVIGPIWALIETGFLPGTPGPNEYGPDPLGA